jgi:hypothetical protein
MATATRSKKTEEDPPEVLGQRAASHEWIYLSEMGVTPAAQRKYQKAHAARIAAEFDLEALGSPVVNRRDDAWWIVDGQHRVGALKILGWHEATPSAPKGQQVLCEVYYGLTEAQEADLFLRRDARKSVPPIDRYKIAVTAGWADETAVNKLVESLGLHVGIGSQYIQASSTLLKVYRAGGETALGRTLIIINEAYGETGFKAPIIEGIGLVITRYGNLATTERITEALQKAAGGWSGLDQKANQLKRSTGNSKGGCVAASVVEYINRVPKRGKKLPDWFKKAT